ncbi:hypothetical protein RI129_005375 [Pyrocoelia pectoralis]|uniref:Uncharacterized protein n=1 Tax=Pyrocoelia pectoralis TaxID=417401 RepID=A0AAN7ZS97_9COLE
MAGGASCSNAPVLCRKCKSKVVTGIKCSKCDNLYHLSCAKLTKTVKFINDNEITCCDDNNVSEVDKDFFDALNKIAGEDGKIDVRIFNYIVRQKDTIISELKNQINYLSSQLEFQTFNLKKFDGQGQHAMQVNKQASVSHDKQGLDKTVNRTQYKQSTSHPTADKPNNNTTICQESSSNMVAVSGVTIANEDGIRNKETNKDSWATVVKRNPPKRAPQKQIVIGEKTNALGVKTVPKKAYLFASRFDPNTTQEAISNLLVSEFPEVSCEQIATKNAQFYSSFKITINFCNLEKAMHPNTWPEGTLVTRFFQRTKPQEVTIKNGPTARSNSLVAI